MNRFFEVKEEKELLEKFIYPYGSNSLKDFENSTNKSFQDLKGLLLEDLNYFESMEYWKINLEDLKQFPKVIKQVGIFIHDTMYLEDVELIQVNNHFYLEENKYQDLF